MYASYHVKYMYTYHAIYVQRISYHAYAHIIMYVHIRRQETI